MGSKLTLTSASAGFGKTTLVSEWIAGCGKPVAWLSLDEGDNDPVRFISYLIAALQTIKAGIGEGLLTALHASQHQPPQVEVVLTTLLNEISVNPDHFIFVLDDYHVIDSKLVDEALAFLVERLPPQMHLVIATREDPSLPLAKLRVRGQLTELRATDLQFTPAEATEFLNRAMGLNLSDDDVAALESRTEGWIAGLQLAALSMQGREDSASFIQAFTGSHRFVLDYLAEEVLQRQSEPIRNFLLRTSILDRFCASLCNTVTERQDGKELLDILEHSNLFLIPLDDQRQWYRYHRLFADVLQTRLMEAQRDAVTVPHSRASAWYEQNGFRSDAIRHSLAAREFERAADLIELAYPVMSINRQFATMLGWLKALPDEVVRVRPMLCFGYAFSSMSRGENESVESHLRDAEHWLNMVEQSDSLPAGMVVVDKKEFRRLPGLIALTRGGQALGRGDMPETVKYAQRALDLAPERDYLMLGGAAAQLGLVAWTNGDLDTARQMTAEGMKNLQLGRYISPAIGCAITLADMQITQGDLHGAMTTYERGLQWTARQGAPILQGAADMHVGMSNLHYEHNDLKTASECLLASQSLGELAGLPQNPYRWRAAMARIRQAQRDLDGAVQLLEEAERVYDGNFSPNVRPVATRKVRVWLAQGRLGEALDWARRQGLSTENELSYLREFDHITLARVILACLQHDRTDVSIAEIMKLLERLLKDAEEGGRKGSAIEILILQALAHQAQGDLPAALLYVQHALALAELEGYVRTFLDEGENMRGLLREASARKIMPDYTDKLLAAFEFDSQNEDKPDLPTAQPSNELLSQRELDVLLLIAEGLSNQEICERLFLALDTVKGHNRKIFNKLQVQRRTEAVARARELGLI